MSAVLLARVAFPDDPEAHSDDAARLAEGLRHQLLKDCLSFCFEIVYSHPLKIDFVAHARALGYQIIMVFIHLESADLNQARVAMGVAEGGYDVPSDKVNSRIPRLLRQGWASIPLVDVLRVYDNSAVLDPFCPMLTIRRGALELHQDPLPGWAEGLLAEREE